MKRDPVNRNDLNALLGQGCSFKGILTFHGTVLIDGTVEGEVHTDDIILIGQQGSVLGDVKGGEVVIGGRMEGTVNAKKVYLKSGGSMKGTLVTAALEVEDGAWFDGESKMLAAGEQGKGEKGIIPEGRK
jgi:cytoskeletal protein CcmA (bactofilin family)